MSGVSSTLGAKLWGGIFGLVCIVIAAGCSPSEAGQSEAATNGVTVVSPSANLRLTRGQILRALAARNRAARNGKAPTETMTRTFDANGNVLTESVLHGNRWVTRSSTLPASLASLSLRSFVPTGAALFDSTRTTLQTATGSYADTTGSGTDHATDSVWSNPSSKQQSTTHDTDNEGNGAVADIYYTGATDAQVGHVEYSTALSTVVILPPGDALYEEFDASGSTWTASVDSVLADSSRWRKSLSAPTNSSRPTVGYSVAPDQGIILYHGIHPFVQADPCETYKTVAAGAIFGFFVTGVVGFGAAILSGGTLSPGAAGAIWGAGATAAGALGAYGYCRHQHPVSVRFRDLDDTVGNWLKGTIWNS